MPEFEDNSYRNSEEAQRIIKGRIANGCFACGKPWNDRDIFEDRPAIGFSCHRHWTGNFDEWMSVEADPFQPFDKNVEPDARIVDYYLRRYKPIRGSIHREG